MPSLAPLPLVKSSQTWKQILIESLTGVIMVLSKNEREVFQNGEEDEQKPY